MITGQSVVILLRVSQSVRRRRTSRSVRRDADVRLRPRRARVHLDGAQSLPLVRRQLRVPHVHDEDEAVTVGFLPNLVLEGVVEDQDFTLLPLPETPRRTRGEKHETGRETSRGNRRRTGNEERKGGKDK